MLTLEQAAKQIGVSKPTLSNAISTGKLSATRSENQSWAIEPMDERAEGLILLSVMLQIIVIVALVFYAVVKGLGLQ